MRVIINMAMSADGKVATPSREPTTFTSRQDKNCLVKIRALCNALVVGAQTAMMDDQTMGIPDARMREARLRQGRMAHPLRVIVSGQLNISPDLPIFKTTLSPLLLVCTKKAPLARRKFFSDRVHLLVCGRTELHVPRLLHWLQTNYRIETLLCEGGPTLNAAFFRARVVDELYLTLSPRILGGKNSPTLVEGKGFSGLESAPQARLLSCHRGQTEWFLHYRFWSSRRSRSFSGNNA